MSARRIIIFRFSAMGDVAMVASVLRELIEQNPDVQLVMVSRAPFEAFFNGIKNLSFHAIKPKKEHKGFAGLYRLYKELKNYQADAVADLHDNIRSRILSLFFRISGTKIRRINKGRSEKQALTRNNNKILKPLKPTVERYADTFRNLSLSLTLKHQLLKQLLPLPEKAKLFFNASIKKIGIAPFAQHIYKMYPVEKMETVIQLLIETGYQVFIFGGGEKEFQIANQWKEKKPLLINTIKQFSLEEELDIISHLDLMLSMDSSGMHMASLMGITVISIWGPTHPFAGFLGYGQSLDDCIQIEHPNRPNSIYGNKPCLCGVEECISLIKPETIVNKIRDKLNG
ncbi:glycosyltransferase family 9 protein [Pedobacter xixiisoli]|uniref:ADP-heptose:LPS heptosyltransferase n=1 Tax=Pedobacter xixiisoli TaxID=1476464 RepID=A0A285ZNZ7_9SPHI|nr:glycosyltransferase family 9 protein [Pedobacter xixiisoli]SOD11401.1 ADP-heptose:LPS heptosyltransferase [Pedobacter xixiisoli]